VPEVLRSGDHARIEEWRRRQAERVTRERRPDLLEGEVDDPAGTTDDPRD
jgi:tRNA (guanine37-N1)-methyltransferase